IRLPAHGDAYLLPHRTPHTVWDAPLWGGPVDRGFACLLLLIAAVGAVLYNQGGQRAAARLFGLGAAGFLALAVLGLTWEPVGRFQTGKLLVPALLFAVVPAAYAAVRLLTRGVVVGGAAVGLAILALPFLPGRGAGRGAELVQWVERVVRP